MSDATATIAAKDKVITSQAAKITALEAEPAAPTADPKADENAEGANGIEEENAFETEIDKQAKAKGLI